MLKNYLRIALMHLRKHRLYSSINIFGLGIGLACCLIIFLFVQDELQYDKHFTNADRIYRVRALFALQQTHSEEAKISYGFAPLLKQDFPVIEQVVRLIPAIGPTPILVRDEKRFFEKNIFLADANVFEVFDFTFLKGDRATALREPLTIVLTEQIARKYFGDEDPIGQTLMLNNEHGLRVTGVIEDLPSTTHMTMEMIASASSLNPIFGENTEDNMKSWGWPNTYTYLLLKENAIPKDLQAQFPAFSERHDAQNGVLSIYLQPLTDIHLHSHLELEMKPNGDITTVYTFSAIAFMILLIACMNFINLTTARATQRAREVGMRKVVGASRTQIIRQFLGESTLLAFVALGIAVVLLWIALPWFNGFVGKELQMSLFTDPVMLCGLILLGLLVGIGAGCYPAFYLSSPMPISVLHGTVSPRTGTVLVRKLLVLLQFSISIMLIVGTGIVYAQMQYAKSMELGYNREHVVVIPEVENLDRNAYETLHNDLQAYSQIQSVTTSSLVPTDKVFAGSGFRIVGQPTEEEPPFFRINGVDFDFFKTYGIHIVAGRTFSREYGSDEMPFISEENPHVEGAVIISAAAAEKCGWTPENAIGKQFRQGNEQQSETYTVVGVAQDIHYASVRSVIEPMIYRLPRDRWDKIGVRITGVDIVGTLAYIDERWEAAFPDRPIIRSFLDEQFDALYRQEEQEGIAFSFFTILAILVAGMGLLGLASFMAERRTKEIGVRKVLGASTRDIVMMMSWDFSKLVIVANILAWPTAYYFMKSWLSDFAYQVDINPFIFIGAGILAFLIVWVTVGLQASWAARANPVNALQDE